MRKPLPYGRGSVRPTILEYTLSLSVFLVTPAPADTFRIELDQMHGAGDHTHSLAQTGQVIQTAINLFACRGHTLIVDADFTSSSSKRLLPEYPVLRRDPDDCEASLFDYSGSPDSFGALRDRYFDHADDAQFWHYAIMAHQDEDKNCNVTSSSKGSDGNGCSANGTLSVVSDENDWGDIQEFQPLRSAGELPPPQEVSCITAEEWAEVQAEVLLRGGCGTPTLSGACIPRNYFVGPPEIYEAGTCQNPYVFPSRAQAAAIPGSAVFLKPGTFIEGGLTLDKPATWLSNTGLTVIR